MGCLRAFVYLFFALVILGAVVLALVLAYETPAPGTPCVLLGQHVIREQDGMHLECDKNVTTGKYFWRTVSERK